MTAKEIALMILALPEDEQNLEMHQAGDTTCHHSLVNTVRVGYLNKYRQETSEGKKVILLGVPQSLYYHTDAEIDKAAAERGDYDYD